jgi:hypothetical protein
VECTPLKVEAGKGYIDSLFRQAGRRFGSTQPFLKALQLLVDLAFYAIEQLPHSRTLIRRQLTELAHFQGQKATLPTEVPVADLGQLFKICDSPEVFSEGIQERVGNLRHGHLQSLSGRLSQLLEALGIPESNVRQGLPVQFNAGNPQPVHQLAVRQLKLVSSSVNPDDPQPPKIPLLLATIPVGVGQRPHNLLFRSTVQLTLGTPVALCLLENLLATF